MSAVSIIIAVIAACALCAAVGVVIGRSAEHFMIELKRDPEGMGKTMVTCYCLNCKNNRGWLGKGEAACNHKQIWIRDGKCELFQKREGA